MYKYLKINLVVLYIITVHVKRHSSSGNCNSQGEVEFEGATFRIFLCLSGLLCAIRFLISLAALIRNQSLSLSSTTNYDLKFFGIKKGIENEIDESKQELKLIE